MIMGSVVVAVVVVTVVFLWCRVVFCLQVQLKMSLFDCLCHVFHCVYNNSD